MNIKTALAVLVFGGVLSVTAKANEFETFFKDELRENFFESAQSSIELRIRDWAEDLVLLKDQKEKACNRSVIRRTTHPFQVSQIHTVGMMRQMNTYVRQFDEQDWDNDPLAPFDGILTRLQRYVNFNATELSSIEELKEIEPWDKEDNIRLFIEVQWFFMRVTDRIYTEQMNDLMVDATYNNRQYNTCYALMTREVRDSELIRGAASIMYFYKLLEKAFDEES